MSYFSKFPTTTFNGQTVLDITRRAKILANINDLIYDYAPYTVKEGEKPEDIAYYYYDDPTYAWLVLLANEIVDVYSEWPKDQSDFDNYIRLQYKDQYEAWRDKELALVNNNLVLFREKYPTIKHDPVLEWTQNATITDNIVEYRSRYNANVKLNVASYLKNPTAEFQAFRIYDYEFEKNENKRNIVLINKKFLVKVDELVGKALSNG